MFLTDPAWLSILFWTAALFTGMVVVDLMFFSISRRRFALGWTVVAMSALALLLYHLSDRYTGVGINEATWYHLRFGTTGLTWGQIMPLVQTVALTTAALGTLFWMSHTKHRKRRMAGGAQKPAWVIVPVLYLLAIGLSPGLLQTGLIATTLLHRDDYRRDLNQALVQAPLTPARTGKLKSVVYLYGESLEGTYLNEQVFPGLTPNLNALRQQSLSLEGIRQAPFTGWTIAGIIASQCAFPALGEQKHTLATPTAGVICLGDILKHNGYTLSYFNGADLSFAGKDHFFHSHGYDKVWGKQELLKQLPEGREMSDWGVYDDDLFAALESEFDRLLAQDQPFFLAALTVDTHPPYGYENPYCRKLKPYGDGQDKMLNAVHCSDQLVGMFIKHLQARGRDDVLIVVGSDHLLAGKRAYFQDAPRHDLWMVHGKGVRAQNIQREGTTFDIAPTLLSLMGLDVPAMHWGRDMLRPAPTLMETYGQRGFFNRIESAFALGDNGRWHQDISNPEPDKPLTQGAPPSSPPEPGSTP